MAVFKYSGIVKNREEMSETGTVVANSKQEAEIKLQKHDLINISLKQITGISAFFKSFSANIR